MQEASEVTHLVQRWSAGDKAALDALLPQVYADLRAIARRELRDNFGHQTLQPTALVNDVLLKLIAREERGALNDRGHFFALAARMMRQLLIDRARRRQTDKHGGAWQREDDFARALDVPAPEAEALPELDEALKELAQIHPRLAQVVELRYFLGLTVEQVATLRKVDQRSIYRDWALARAWLHERLARD